MEELKPIDVSQNNMESEPNEVVFDCSIKSEIERVKNTLSDLKWYKENKYNLEFIKLPKSIQQKVEKREDITDEEISKAVYEEFEANINTEKITQIEPKWNEIKEKFFENLKTLGLPLQETYTVHMTKYGSGGSYHRPNTVKLNFETRMGVLTLAHEIVHLTIDSLIRKYNIEQWTKERIVDLTMNKFFPEKQGLQKMQIGQENAEKIGEIFESNFPNIEKIIEEISEIK
ncbi:MAG: hypothetical protein AAB446_00415 [Patescibacteria group bacterium]